MKTATIVLGTVMGVGVMALLGCHRHRITVIEQEGPVVVEREVVVEPRPRQLIVLREAPPPLRVEHRPPPPSHGHVWISGYYAWQNGYVWVPGHHVIPPRPGAGWVADAWVSTQYGWRYAPGHWR